MSTLAERQRHDGIEADTDATPRRALRILIFEYAVCLQIAIVSMSARNAGVTVSIEGPTRPRRGHERGQGCRVRGSACAAGRRVVRAALASTGADARSAQSCTRRCVRIVSGHAIIPSYGHPIFPTLYTNRRDGDVAS